MTFRFQCEKKTQDMRYDRSNSFIIPLVPLAHGSTRTYIHSASRIQYKSSVAHLGKGLSLDGALQLGFVTGPGVHDVVSHLNLRGNWNRHNSFSRSTQSSGREGEHT